VSAQEKKRRSLREGKCTYPQLETFCGREKKKKGWGSLLCRTARASPTERGRKGGESGNKKRGGPKEDEEKNANGRGKGKRENSQVTYLGEKGLSGEKRERGGRPGGTKRGKGQNFPTGVSEQS